MSDSLPEDALPAVEKPKRVLEMLDWTATDWLWFFVYLGMAVRVLYPFSDDPLRHLFSDAQRHFDNASKDMNFGLYSASDALGYQMWLSAAIHVFGKSHFFSAAYAGILSATTAYIWYQWFKLCLPSKRMALWAYVLIVWLPDWIKIYSYFMEETLLLPLVGLMLYFGWKAKDSLALKDCLLFGGAVGLSFITKATCAPMAAIAYCFLARNLQVRLPRSEFIDRLIPSVAIAVSICLLAPISFYSRTGCWSWFLPAQAGSNKQYYESGKMKMKVTAHYFDRFAEVWKDEEYWFGCPSYYTHQLVPFSEWSTPRTGEVECHMDFGGPANTRFLPKIDVTLGQRIELTLENWIYFFVGFVWPTEYPYSQINFVRWIWPFCTIAIIVAAVKKRRLNELDILFFGTLLVFLLQQECGMEGRYRMCWEGVVIPTLILAISDMWKKRAGEEQLSVIPAVSNETK